MAYCVKCMNNLEIEIENNKSIFICDECKYKKEVLGIYRHRVRIDSKNILEGVKKKEYPERYALCPECPSVTANYYQMQTRSADEPMTIFNTCVKCKHTWRE